MSDVTRLLCAMDRHDPKAAEELRPLLYDELRKLAAQKMAHNRPARPSNPPPWRTKGYSK